MAEFLAPTAALNVAPGKRIGILSAHSGPNSTRSRRVCFTNYVMNLALLRRGFAHRERPRDVRTIAVEHGAEVDQQQVAGSDDAGGRPRVGQRRAFPAGDDRLERMRLAAASAQLTFQHT